MNRKAVIPLTVAVFLVEYIGLSGLALYMFKEKTQPNEIGGSLLAALGVVGFMVANLTATIVTFLYLRRSADAAFNSAVLSATFAGLFSPLVMLGAMLTRFNELLIPFLLPYGLTALYWYRRKERARR